MIDENELQDRAGRLKRDPKMKAAVPYYTPEQRVVLGEAAYNRKMEALDANIGIRHDDQWRTLHTSWEESDEETRKSTVFGLAYNSGFKARDMARLFRIKTSDLQEYKEIIDQGLAALKLKITSNQISYGLSTEQPIVKFHLGKQFAEQVDNPAHEGVDTVEASIPNIVINEVKHNNQELRAELEAAVQAAIKQNSPNLKLIK